MSHLDDDVLAAIAMGDGTAADVEHATSCERCAAELATFTALTERLGAMGSGALTPPPAGVWDAIAADVSGRPSATQPEPELGSAPRPREDLAARREDRARATTGRSGPRWWALGAAAAAGVVIGGVGVAALGGGDDEAVRSVLASSELTDLATEQPAGEATVEVLDDGERVLVVDTSDFEDVEDAYLEVWLIDEQIEGMVSLGHLTGERTVFTLPAGVDIAQFPIVDISVEPVDGIPTHSGQSVTRGVLDA
ncbi:anti-sigma factor [Demequina sp. NBRC 110055]|uniref:anti-sigma factor n=1 Tax=Demequina sp. NBRC 110055 TaxID=1570344 RepID=UPI000A02D13A|nr:anti-sigma factor [Demequina sp. NBRC 110055]